MSNKKYHRGLYTGVFDIIHPGHIIALNRAKEMCDELVVAVSTDEVVMNYKHHYPMQPYEYRSLVVESLKAVDQVVPQEDVHDKIGMCDKYNCDVIFSSDEYQIESYEDQSKMTAKEIAGVIRWQNIQEEANKAGIDIVYLPRTQGISSTMIKEQIAETIRAEQVSRDLLPSGQNIEMTDVLSQ